MDDVLSEVGGFGACSGMVRIDQRIELKVRVVGVELSRECGGGVCWSRYFFRAAQTWAAG